MKTFILFLFLSLGASSCIIEDDYDWEKYEVIVINRSDEALEDILIGPHSIPYIGPNERTGPITMKNGSHEVGYYRPSKGIVTTTIKLGGSSVSVQVYL